MKTFKLTAALLFAVLLFTQCKEDGPIDALPVPVEECGDVRYNQDIFDEVQMTTVQYGENMNFNGTELEELMVDVYEPIGDEQEMRPLIIWAFGGSFIGGERSNMAAYAESNAKKGFVGASIDYRILDAAVTGIPDSVLGLDIAVKAMGDMKAAIRFFRQDAATDNIFRIDPDKIFIGGLSAGGIVALTVGLTQEDDIIWDHVRDALDANGGFEGSSGDAENMAYSSEVSGIINLSGAAYNLNWLDANDPPIVAIHGNADETVQYDCGFANVFGFDIIRLCGSGAIKEKADAIGHNTRLVTVEGGGHTDIYSFLAFAEPREEFFENVLKAYLIEGVCE